MKLSKRILSLMIVLVFTLTSIITTSVSAATFSDVPDTEKYANAVTVLNSLGIINGYEDGTFRPENNVTRAEFTAMLMRARGLANVGDASLENPPYPDVVSSDVSWAIANIRTAQSLGIINGYEDGTFRPNNNVLLEEAVKMIVCAIGYANYSPEGAEWYTKYIVSATKLGILKSVSASVGTPATRAHIAQLIHNTLEVKIADENGVTDNTLLDNELKLTQATGYIFSNDVTSLENPDISLKSDYIIIGNENGVGTRFKFKDAAKYKDKLGYRVDYFYSYDKDAGENVISSMTIRNNNVIDINAADIDTSKSGSSSIEYYDSASDNDRAVSLAGDIVVVYNDKLYGATPADSDFNDYLTGVGGFPTVGNIVLLDNDDDNAYDIAFVNDYEVYAVTSVSGSPTYTVTDTLTRVTPNNKIVLNPKTDDNLRFVDKNGATQSFSNISTGSVINVKKSNSGNGGLVLTTVVISKETAKGSVKSVTSGRRVKIDSTTYDYSYQAPWIDTSRGASLAEPTMGDNGTYYLDLFGDVVAYKKTTTATNQQYAYVIYGSVENKNMEDMLALRMFTQNKGLVTAYSNDNTKINGDSTKTPAEMLTALQTAASVQAQGVTATNNPGINQVVKVSLTSDSEKTIISEIITATKGDNISEVLNDKLQMSNKFNANSKDSEYIAGSTTLRNSQGTASIGSSWIITVPNDRASEKGYKKVSISGNIENGSAYRAEVYDITTSNTAKVVVLYDLSVAVNAVKTNTSPFVITEIIQESNPDNQNKTMYKLKGYAGKGKTEVEYWGSPESNALFAKLQVEGAEGDVVRLGRDSDNFYTLAEKDILFSKQRNIRNTVISNYASGGTLDGCADGSGRYYLNKNYSGNTYSAIWGYLYACDDTNLLIHDYEYSDKSLVEDGTSHSYSVSKMSDSLFLRYSGSGNSFEITQLNGEGFNYVEYLKTLPNLDKELAPTEIFMFDINGKPDIVIIVE